MRAFATLALVAGCHGAASVPDDHRIHRTDTADRTTIAGKAVDLSTVPLANELGGLPVGGFADVDIDVKAPKRDYAHANGQIIVHCASCQIGDDKATLQPPGNAGAFAGPIYFGHVDLGRVDVDVAITDGKLTVKQLTMTSSDLELTVTGGGTLATKLEDSQIDLCLRFKPTAALAKRDPKTSAVLALTGAPTGQDGFFNIRLTDRVGSMKRLAQVCDGSGAHDPPTPTRPQLTTP